MEFDSDDQVLYLQVVKIQEFLYKNAGSYSGSKSGENKRICEETSKGLYYWGDRFV